MENYYFTAQKLCVGYEGTSLIQDIELSLAKGEILTLIGPNGAGKTTVLKSIAGQLALTGGTLWLDGASLTDLKQSERAKKMAALFTEKSKTEFMSCAEMVEAGRYPYTGRFGLLSEYDRKCVQEAMRLVDAAEFSEKEFQKCSDGQKQRVLLARAICQEPEILLLDEPASYLDIRHKLELLSILQELKRKKKLTVIMSLHELDLAERISDKILCLKGEYMEKFGTPQEIFADGFIHRLYDITKGSFWETDGMIELEKPKGEAQVFVLAGGGSGRRVYRRLQREGCAFVTGILYENDLDYPSACALAAETLCAKAFEPVPEELYKQAKAQMEKCKRVICTKAGFGSLEWYNKELLLFAKQLGKPIEYAIG